MTKLAIVLFGLYVAFGQRATLSAATGGRGLVSPFEILFVLVAFLVGVGLLSNREPVKQPGLWPITAGPLLFLLVVLPFVGVMTGNYSVRTLYSWTSALVPMAILITTRAAQRRGLGHALEQVAFLAITAHGLYGLGQMLARLGLLPPSLWSWATQWDVEAQGAYSEQYLIYGRSTGLFINANVFGLWSVLAATFAASRLRGWQRMVGILLGLLGALGSQSRTAWACAVLVVIAFAIAALTRPKVASRVVVMAVWAAPPLIGAFLLGLPQLLQEGTAATRLESGLRIFSVGVAGDANLLGRANAWSQAEAFARDEFPFGTLGPPQTYFVSFIDNQYVAFFLQGSVVMVLAFLMALATPLAFWRRGINGAGILGVMCACVALSSLTMLPMDAPAATALVWLAAGTAMAREGSTGEFDELGAGMRQQNRSRSANRGTGVRSQRGGTAAAPHPL